MQLNIKERIRELAREGAEEVVRIRRHLHRFPELSFKETETARFVCQALDTLGIPYQPGIGGNGISALIEGLEPERNTIALRADMDALPIQEENETPYVSANPGVMHACGHDVHTASLLGAAAILNALKGQFKGTVKLIFQPGEELLPGGASLMIREGVLENPRPSGVFGQHVHPPLEAGKVGFRPGKYMASADELYVTIRGRGGHGALPHECVDPVLISAHVITALQQIVSRNANPIIPSVLTFGKIESAGGWTNIIPDSVELTGTFRTLDETWRFEAHQRMQRIAEGIAESMGGSCDFRIVVGYPFLYNDELLTARAKSWAIDFLGADKVVDLPLRLSSEDFAFYSQELPSCFYRLGTGNPEKGITHPVHSSRFDIDEAALETGAGLMAWLAVCALGEGLPS
ncbi:MAG: N-acetyldiaminopimelate deacetylase [Haliscomenobacter sp.]|jgi:amidohydrolase|nr:N-acetyldiaminopimelate deacetylase [Haliscomenobacter sp.]